MNNPPCIRVAYAEDHVLVRKGIISLVSEPGAIEFVLEASNGEDLLQQISASPVKPDVCLLDISMKQMDGFETTRQLKKLWPCINVLALTSHASEYYMIRMFQNGADGYLLKNIPPAELKMAIRKLYEQGFFYSQTATRAFVKAVQGGSVKMPALTPFEEEVIKHCCTDRTYKDIGVELGKNEKSIKNCVEHLFTKFSVHNRSQLIMQAILWGLGEQEPA